MKEKWEHFKNNVLYYWSVIDLTVTGFVFHLIHIMTKRKRPTMMSKEMLEELERLYQEDKKERETPGRGSGGEG